MAALPRSHRDSYDIGHFAANGWSAVSWLLVAALAVAGLFIGWWLRTVAVRLAVPAGEQPRAWCPACGHQITAAGRPPAAQSRRARARAAVAAGLRLRPAASPWGRCPACRARVGPAPLAVELSTAILLGALAARVHPGLVLAAACWLAVCAVPLAWIDAAVQRLPDLLTGPAYAGTAGLLLLAAAAGGHWHTMLRALLGGLALAAAYLALVVVSRSAIGLGDAKLAASLGTMLAWAGWPVLAAGTLAGFLLAAIYGVGLLLLRRASWRQRVPFGPFMIAGAFAALLAASF
jgi:leader peptidase (prepilin peptidase) / N-methyltransferase